LAAKKVEKKKNRDKVSLDPQKCTDIEAQTYQTAEVIFEKFHCLWQFWSCFVYLPCAIARDLAAFRVYAKAHGRCEFASERI
jgi:hypothetical protein